MYFIIYFQGDSCQKVLPRFRLFQPRTYLHDHAVPGCVVVVVVVVVVFFLVDGSSRKERQLYGLFLTKLGRNICARVTGETSNSLVFIWGQHTVSE